MESPRDQLIRLLASPNAQELAGRLLACLNGPELDLSQLSQGDAARLAYAPLPVWACLDRCARESGMAITSVTLGPHLAVQPSLVAGLREFGDLGYLRVSCPTQDDRIDLGELQGSNSSGETVWLTTVVIEDNAERTRPQALTVVLPPEASLEVQAHPLRAEPLRVEEKRQADRIVPSDRDPSVLASNLIRTLPVVAPAERDLEVSLAGVRLSLLPPGEETSALQRDALLGMLRAALTGTLECARPAGEDPVAYRAAAYRLASALVAGGIATRRSTRIVGADYAEMLKGLASAQGKPASYLMDASRIYHTAMKSRVRALMADAQEPASMARVVASLSHIDGFEGELASVIKLVDAVNATVEARKHELTNIRRNLATALFGSHRSLQTEALPFTPGKVRDALAKLTSPGNDAVIEIARTLIALRQQPELAPDVLDWINEQLEARSSAAIRLRHPEAADARIDALAGIWEPVAGLLLNLHPQALAKMVLTRGQVDKLRAQALVLLGSLYLLSAKVPVADLQAFQESTRRFMRSADDASAMNLGRLALKYAGQALRLDSFRVIVERMESSLHVLSRNAMRLEALADLAAQAETKVEGFDRMLLLDNLPDVFEQVAQMMPDDDVPPAALMDGLGDAERILRLGAADEAGSASSSSSSSSGARMGQRGAANPGPLAGASGVGTTGPRSAGSHRDVSTGRLQPPSMHFHPALLKGLKRSTKEQRLQTLRARQMGMLGSYEEVNAAFDRLVDDAAEARRARSRAQVGPDGLLDQSNYARWKGNR